MDGEVTKLCSQERSKTAVHLPLTWTGVQWMVDVVANVGSKAPVVATVLEQVHDRHGGVAEPVHKDGLEQPLGVVEHPK